MTIDLQKGIIYGPVKSRRLGRSLGLNLLADDYKLCSFNCAYCQYGWTQKLTTEADGCVSDFPSVADIINALRERIATNPDFDCVTFSGNGEPTMHPEFPQIVEAVKQIRDQWLPKVRLALLSNSATCDVPKIREAIEKIDLPIMKLDVGNEMMFKKINHGAPPLTLQQIVDSLKSLKRIVIQTMFVSGRRVNNSSEWEVRSWMHRLEELQPLWVQIYSLDRGAANDKLEKVSRERLDEIARKVAETTGLKVEVF
jgi:wyosine [tRNA(Phe)-imidazoG37] synthetase (radical SAM superfamily)